MCVWAILQALCRVCAVMYTAADDRGYDVWTLVYATCSLFSLRILFHAALARHGCLDHCTHIYLSILAQAFSNEVSFLSGYSFANVLIYFTLTDSLCQVFMYSKWEFLI